MTPVREALRQLVYRIRQRSTNKLHNREYQMTLDDCVRELAALSAAQNSLPHGEHWVYTTPQGWDIEEIAQWLHDETGHPDSYPNHTWPETERDDGQRAGAFVKIVPLHAQEYFRDIARRLVTQLDRSALRREAPAPAFDLTNHHNALRDKNRS